MHAQAYTSDYLPTAKILLVTLTFARYLAIFHLVFMVKALFLSVVSPASQRRSRQTRLI